MTRLNFIKHNEKYFKKNFKNQRNNEILVEFNGWQLCHIMNSYLANVLSERYKANIKAYPGYNNFDSNFLSQIFDHFKWKIANFIHIKNFAIYKSFNTESFLLPNLDSRQKMENKKIFEKVITQIKSKRDLLNLKVKNIYIGDLIYNSYLLDKRFEIDLKSDLFKKYLYRSLGLFLFWIDYFKLNSVKAIIVTHTVYLPSIGGRIAQNLGIPVYSAVDDLLNKYDKKFLHRTPESKTFKKIFLNLPLIKKKKYLKISHKMIKLRFSGEKKYFLDHYKKTSPFLEKNLKKKKNSRIIDKSKKIKILIAAHCFFDSPHIYGPMFFSDFHDWIDHLGKLSLKTDYDWYIKTHRNFFPETLYIIENYCKKYKRLKLIPPDISHRQIISEGIDIALTCYGTIGWEYPFLDVPVLLASTNHPYQPYDFNIKPKNLKEYDKILKNLDKQFIYKQKKKIKKYQILEYYFMNYIYGKKSWLLRDLEKEKYLKYLKILRTGDIAFSNKIYDIWMKLFTQKKHKEIIDFINNFFDSSKSSSNFL